ncbi:uncharacterized protein BKA78DRAFT_187073 [Phyllosticta capitalensis]|uniref:uncharacterized protein n=1 Tax=Phyllosticta capitalensis TaxID=121624 RepID=UPI003131D19F
MLEQLQPRLPRHDDSTMSREETRILVHRCLHRTARPRDTSCGRLKHQERRDSGASTRTDAVSQSVVAPCVEAGDCNTKSTVTVMISRGRAQHQVSGCCRIQMPTITTPSSGRRQDTRAGDSSRGPCTQTPDLARPLAAARASILFNSARVLSSKAMTLESSTMAGWVRPEHLSR